jgi:hypothetical protein
MVRKLLVSLAALATTLGLMVPTATTASAFTNEWLGCAVTGGNWYYTSPCSGGASSGSVILDFKVMDETASSTYNWAVPSDLVSRIFDGCTSTSNRCEIQVGRGSRYVTVSVTLTQGGASETLSTTASVEPWCGSGPC